MTETAPKPKKPRKPAVKPKATAKPAAVRAPGRPSVYSDKTAAQLCEYIADGKSLRTACAMPGMPSTATVMRWLSDERPEFREQYARAREAQADLLAEQILQIADDGTNDSQTDDDGNVRVDQDVIARSRLRVDARKWLASKMAPKKYGDKLALGGADDLGPIQTATKPMTDAERAVRLSRMLGGNPDALAELAAKLGGST